MGLTSLVPSGDLNDQALAPLALGGLTKGVTLLELTGTYSSFANNGINAKPFGITRVYDHQDRLIYRGSMDQATSDSTQYSGYFNLHDGRSYYQRHRDQGQYWSNGSGKNRNHQSEY